MVDSDDAQIELVGEMRGDRMVVQEWEMFEAKQWDRCRERYAGNTEERKQEKINLFREVIGDDYDDDEEDCIKMFFEGD